MPVPRNPPDRARKLEDELPDRPLRVPRDPPCLTVRREDRDRATSEKFWKLHQPELPKNRRRTSTKEKSENSSKNASSNRSRNRIENQLPISSKSLPSFRISFAQDCIESDLLYSFFNEQKPDRSHCSSIPGPDRSPAADSDHRPPIRMMEKSKPVDLPLSGRNREIESKSSRSPTVAAVIFNKNRTNLSNGENSKPKQVQRF